jgi:phosphoglycerol transferase MdoB-like AlkP superfamily enzyme
LFYIFNITSFENTRIIDFVSGIWFDAIAICLAFLILAIIYLFPLPIRGYRIFQVVNKTIFMVIVLAMIALNLLDFEYFAYTSKRSTIDLFSVLAAGSDFKQNVTVFITDFWHLLLMLITSAVIIWKWYSKIGESNETFKNKPKNFYVTNTVSYILVLTLFVIVGRGGFQLRPVGILEASNFTSSQNTALVLNTPFTMIKSFDNKVLEEQDFFSTIEATEKYFNPIQKSQPLHLLPDSTNVVIIILESFGSEFVGFTNNGGVSYTPFLDSLMRQSLTFSHSFANGKKSIEAVPSILASIPSLMNDPFITSSYGSNKIVGLPELLKKFGYESAFYHGATNGSMNFDIFTKSIGFDHYIGRTEYGNESHTDESWGVLDEYFEPWSAQQMSQLKPPFFATLFTISSHHPYFIPENWKSKVKKGPQEIAASINYGDHSLRLFFETAKKQKWFKNTVFILCADHSPASSTPFYNLRTNIYQIPMAIYAPSGKIKAEKKQGIFKQLDIYPSILDLLNIKTNFYSYGNSVFQKSKNQSFSYLEGVYYYFKNGHMLTFSNKKARNLYSFENWSTSLVDSISYLKPQVKEYEKTLKAIIQRYNHDLIRNQTAIE